MNWDLNPQQSQPEVSDFGNQYLTNIPDEDRAVVAKYVKDWDGNVTRKFQELQGQISEYQRYGDVSEIEQARMVVQQINSDPVGFANNLQKYINDRPEQFGGRVQEDDFEPGEEDEAQQAIRELTQRLDQVSTRQDEFIGSQQEQEEAEMLDSALDDLHNEHGDFDDKWVTMQLAQGASPEEAVASWNELKQGIIDSRSKPPPNLLTGEGNGVPIDQVDPNALRNPTTRKQIGADYLKRALGA